jgi:hypothetical protein
LVGFICKLADGEFVRNEDFEQYEQDRLLLKRTTKELERERLEKGALQKELELLKAYSEQQVVNRQSFNQSFDNIKDKFDKGANKTKNNIGGIVEFD